MSRILLILGILFLAWMGYRFLNKTWSTRVKEVEKSTSGFTATAQSRATSQILRLLQGSHP
ncbi:hypothetical protein [sulfur-oxidizing endosymbiont of Gigantopelta aegis]|uniref:hypothetical protein n=1 Tax=sulfur-oxidizing endosymbiont of Gigantopelta aegis TaxID=2794934 RepID=UPI0018DE7489|nr:hypothetical protein [sulfur-oxidizing endosymbiont of Gigantopelta aegis]